MGVEDGRDAADRFAHQLKPGEREFAVGLGVIERDDLVFEQLIKTAASTSLWNSTRAVLDLSTDGPAIVAVVAFAPPAIEHAQVKSAVWRQFHSAGAAGFQRAQRIVQPKIDALHEPARDVGVVVFHENDRDFRTRLRG